MSGDASTQPETRQPVPSVSVAEPSQLVDEQDTNKPGDSDDLSLSIVYLCVFIDISGIGLIIPVLPFYSVQLGANGLELGLLFTVYSIGQAISGFVMGWASDRVGRRPVLMASLIGSAIGYVLCAVSTNLAFLFFARAFGGLFGGSIPTAFAYISDVKPKEERPKYFGLVGASIGVAFTIAPAIGAGLAEISAATAFYAAAGFSFLSFILAVFKLKESFNGRKTESVDWRWYNDKRIVSLVLVHWMANLTFSVTQAIYPLLLTDKYGQGSLALGMILLGIGVVQIIVLGGLIGRLIEKVGAFGIECVGLFLIGGGMALYPLFDSFAVHVTFMVIHATGFALHMGAINPLLSFFTPQEMQGEALGLLQGAQSLGSIIGPTMYGELYDASKTMVRFWVHSLPFFIAGVSMAIPFGIALYFQVTVGYVAGGEEDEEGAGKKEVDGAAKTKNGEEHKAVEE